MARTPLTAFRLTEHDRAGLKRLADELDCSEADVVRWGISALSGLQEHGLDDWTTTGFFKDQRRVIVLQGERGRSLTLAERPDGSFYAGMWVDEAAFEDDPEPAA